MSKSVLIVDDEEDARELLKVHLARHQELRLIGEAKNGLEALEAIRSQQPDIVLIDIQMPEMNGIALAEQLVSYALQIVFITAYDQFAVKAFELNAMDYLLKPFGKDRFDQTIRKVLSSPQQPYQQFIETLSQTWISKQYLKRFTYRTGLNTLFIPVDEVWMIESADQYVEIHTASRKYLIRLAMDYLESILDPALFFRTHRSYFVNLGQVRSVEQYESRNFLIHLNGDLQAKLSRDKRDHFSRLLTGNI